MNKTIVYVDGVFDLFHYGHIEFLLKAKKLGDILMVGVVSDKDVESYKRTPIISHEHRIHMIRHCSLVDIIIENPPLIITEDFISKHKINIVVHGNDSAQQDFFNIPIQLGIMKYVEYTPCISTTKIINKIKENHKFE